MHKNLKFMVTCVSLIAIAISLYGMKMLLSPAAPQSRAQGLVSTLTAPPLAASIDASVTSPKINLEKLQVKEIRKLELDCTPRVALDGEHYTCGRADGLWYGSFANGLEKRLVEFSNSAFWLRDGKHLAYLTPTLPGQPDELRMLEIESGESSVVAEVGSDPQLQVLSNQQVFFALHDEIMEWNPMNESVELAFPSKDLTKGSLHWLVSADARYLAVQHNANEIAALSIMNRESGKKIAVTDKIDEAYGAFVWSLDGTQLYYSIVDPVSRTPELWRVSADGTTGPELIWRGSQRGAFERLTWMPDGETLLLVHARKTGAAEIDDTYYAVDTITGNHKALFTNGSGITLLNEGKSLLFRHNMTERTLYIAELEW